MHNHQQMHQHLLDLLGAKDHEDAARIIAGQHARELAASQPAAPAHYGPLRDADAEYGKRLQVYASTPAQPAAPQGGAYAELPDERAAFEAWIKKDCGDLSTFGSGQNIHYSNSAVNNAWTGWKARASHGQAPAGAVPEKVYLVATGLTNEAGTVELYERHDRFVPLADCEVLYTAPTAQPAPAASEWDVRGHLAASLTCWHRLTGKEANELVALFQGRAAPAAGAVAGPGWRTVPVEPTQAMLSAMAECDGYLPGDRDRPGLVRWEDYWRMAIAAAPTPAAQADSGAQEDAALLDWLDADGGECVFNLGKTWYTRGGHGQPYRKRANLRAAIRAALAQKEGK